MGDKHYYLKKKIKRVEKDPSPTVESDDTPEDLENTQRVTFQVQNHEPREVPSGSVIAISRTRDLGKALVGVGLGVVALTFLFLGGLLINQAQAQVSSGLVAQTEAGVRSLESAAEDLQNFEIVSAKQSFQSAEESFALSASEMFRYGQGTAFLSQLPYYKSQITGAQKVVFTGLKMSRSGIFLTEGLEPLMSAMEGGDSGEQLAQRLGEVAGQSRDDFARARRYAREGEEIFNSLSASELPAGYRSDFDQIRNRVALMSGGTDLLYGISDNISDILGFDTSSFLLTLNHNNMELRPTGGGVGTVTGIWLDNGEVQKVNVTDSYDINGRLGVGHYPSSSFMVPNKTEGIVQRDEPLPFPSTWSPDFKQVADQAVTLYERSGGGTPYIVVGLTPEFFGNLIDIFGSISVPERDLEITPDNAVRALDHEIHIEARDEPNPKEAVMSHIAPVLKERIVNADKSQIERLFKSAFYFLDKGDMMFYSRNDDLQEMFETLDWAGRIRATEGQQDYLNVNRVNVGARKSSLQIQPDYDYSVTIDDGGNAYASLTMNFEHIPDPDQPLGGRNVDYVRVFTPSGSQLTSVRGKDPNTVTITENQHGKQVFGFWVTTERNTTRQVTINYELPFTFADGNDYELIAQKQPGTKNQELSVRIITPPDWGSDPTREIFSDGWTEDLEFMHEL